MAPAVEDAERGTTLVEVVLALMLLGVVMLAALGTIVGALRGTDAQTQRQAASSLAAQALELTRSVPTPLLVRGRTAASVAALRTAGTTLVDTTGDDVASLLTSDALASDPSHALTVPTSVSHVVAGTTYTVKTFIELCWLRATGPAAAPSQRCTAVATGGSRATYRLTAEVTWPRPAASSCRGPAAAVCSRAVTTLRDAAPRDPAFVEPVFPAGLVGPSISSVSPGTVASGSTVTLTLTGGGFQVGAVVSESGTGTVGSATITDATVTFPFTADAAAGTYTFTVTNPDGGITAPPGRVQVTELGVHGGTS